MTKWRPGINSTDHIAATWLENTCGKNTVTVFQILDATKGLFFGGLGGVNSYIAATWLENTRSKNTVTVF